jgi:uncharacterized protein
MTQRDDLEWRVWHGAVLLALVYAGTVSFRMWPWPLLVPLLVYAAMLALWPRWRATCAWARLGAISRGPVAVAVIAAMVAVIALVEFHTHARPDVSSVRARLDLDRLPHPIVWAVFFSVLNAAMEEAVFRGALFDALTVRLGVIAAVLISSAAFGAAHVAGYPPGAVGAVLAGLFGAVLASLRIWTGGLLLPTAVHICADATISWVVLAG